MVSRLLSLRTRRVIQNVRNPSSHCLSGMRSRTTFTMIKYDSSGIEKFRFGFLPTGLKTAAYFANASILSVAPLIHPICLGFPLFITYISHQSIKNFLFSLLYQTPLWGWILYTIFIDDDFDQILPYFEKVGFDAIAAIILTGNAMALMYLPCAIPVRYVYHTIRVAPGRIASKIMSPFRKNVKIQNVMNTPIKSIGAQRAAAAAERSEIRKGVERRLGQDFAAHLSSFLVVSMTALGGYALAQMKNLLVEDKNAVDRVPRNNKEVYNKNKVLSENVQQDITDDVQGHEGDCPTIKLQESLVTEATS